MPRENAVLHRCMCLSFSKTFELLLYVVELANLLAEALFPPPSPTFQQASIRIPRYRGQGGHDSNRLL